MILIRYRGLGIRKNGNRATRSRNGYHGTPAFIAAGRFGFQWKSSGIVVVASIVLTLLKFFFCVGVSGYFMSIASQKGSSFTRNTFSRIQHVAILGLSLAYRLFVID